MRHPKIVASRLRINETFVSCCIKNDLEGVKKSLKQGANIHYRRNRGLLASCLEGHTQIVEFLLCAPDLKHHARLKSGDHVPSEEDCLNYALEGRSASVVKFLCLSTTLPKNPCLFFRNHWILTGPLQSSCPAELVEFVVNTYHNSTHKKLLEKCLEHLLLSAPSPAPRIKADHTVLKDEIFRTLSDYKKIALCSKALASNLTPTMKAFLEKQSLLNAVSPSSPQHISKKKKI